MKIKYLAMAAALMTTLFSCSNQPKEDYAALANQYAKVTLTTDISHLTDNEVQMLGYLFEAGKIMDDIYWTENFGGDKNKFLESIEDPNARKYAEINYGPWDQLDNRRVFIPGYGPKPAGAGFYPTDMTKEEFEAFSAKYKADGFPDANAWVRHAIQMYIREEGDTDGLGSA